MLTASFAGGTVAQGSALNLTVEARDQASGQVLSGYRGRVQLAASNESVQAWGGGLWGLLAFAMQMCLVMLTGYIVAVSPLFTRALDALARVPRGPRSAVAWMGLLSMTLGLLNWGVSIVGSAVLARALARRRGDVDYRLLVAAAYLGLGCTWHAGLSASAPMTVALPSGS